jgi:hypothetical protein
LLLQNADKLPPLVSYCVVRQNPKFTDDSHNPELLKLEDCKTASCDETIFVSYRQYNSAASQHSVSCVSVRSFGPAYYQYLCQTQLRFWKKIPGFVHNGDE